MCHHPGLDPLTESTPEEWQAVAGVNLMGALHYCRAALPTLCGSGQIPGPQRGQASIVNVSSGYADKGRAGRGLYDATKAGLLAFTGTLAHEEAAIGVRVNAPCPGSTLTDFHVNKARAAGKTMEQPKTERQTTSQLGRWKSPGPRSGSPVMKRRSPPARP